MSLSQLTELLGWATVINIGYLFLATFVIAFMNNSMSSIHGKMFGLEKKDLNARYFDFLSYYKIVTLVFMVAPYISLKIMGY